MKLTKYNQYNTSKMTIDIGEITPIYTNRLFPGEKIKNFSYKNITRMITPIFPTLDNAKFEIYAFATPIRLLNYQTTNTEKEELERIILKNTNNDADAFCFPEVLNEFNKEDEGIFKEIIDPIINKNVIAKNSKNEYKLKHLTKYSLEHNQIEEWEVNADYFLAYWKIYNDFFKDKRIEYFNFENLKKYLSLMNQYWDNIEMLKKDGTIEYTTFEETITNLKNDFGLGKIIYNWTSNSIQNILKMWQSLFITLNLSMTNTNNDYLNDLKFDINTFELGKNFNEYKQNISRTWKNNILNITGKNYANFKDTLIKTWNVDNGDKTQAILLGYSEYQQSIQQITNTTKSENNALGEIGGMSCTFNQDLLFKEFEAKEETIISIIAIPTYKMYIKNSNELNEEYSNQQIEKFTPQNNEIHIDYLRTTLGNGNDLEEKIGYKLPYQWMRKKKDIITNELIDKYKGWTYTLDIKDFNKINTNILKLNKKPFKETLIAPEEDSFIVEFGFNCEILRHIPKEYEIIEQLKGNEAINE